MAEDTKPVDELLQSAQAAREEASRSDAGGRFQIIRFTTGGREFAIPIESVLRTERVPPIVPVPRAPDYICGIASLRGGVVCIIDLGHLLSEGQTSVADEEARSLLILGVGSRRLGVLSETLPDFERIEPAETLGIPTSDKEIYSGALERGEGLLGIIDPIKLMDHIEGRLTNAIR